MIPNYADDTTIVNWGTNENDLAQNCSDVLFGLKNYFQNNHLSLNINKTSLMVFQVYHKQDEMQWSVVSDDCSEIKLKDKTSFLGIMLDQHLSWEHHIDFLCHKLSKSIYAMWTMSQFLKYEQMSIIYYALVYPYLTYEIEVWEFAAAKHVNTVFTLQKKAVRIMCKLRYKGSCKAIFKIKKLLTLPSLYIYKTVQVMLKYKQYNHLNREVHMYNTRRDDDYHLERNNSKSADKSPYYMEIKFYNKLPKKLKSLSGSCFEGVPQQ
ncbi:uncharacterized protein LOC124798988 [Schistocerca piceifrons]|uniref:uncharacterized protein LOC124798988 n=1 Tax=Schistocerca piceifrons TaxID=274613 RepID=UPI001F5F3AF5|nr:uncharacterized protein LOC124798988 [Schistocerca piceifrons]